MGGAVQQHGARERAVTDGTLSRTTVSRMTPSKNAASHVVSAGAAPSTSSK
jgi:hypothetical protein